MSFAIFLVFLAVTYLRPAEAFSPEMESYRITFWISIVSLAASLASVLAKGSTTTPPQTQVKTHSIFLIGLLSVAIFASLASKAYFGEALNALSVFSPSAVTFLLTLMNVTNMKRLKITCFTIAFCTVVLAVASIMSYHTGFMMDQLMMSQRVESTMIDDINGEQAIDIPAQDVSGKYLWRVRSLGFLNDPNDYGQAIVMVLPFLFGGYVSKKKIHNVIFVGTPIAILIYTIYLTHSRGAILGIAALFFFTVKRRYGWLKTALFLVFLAALSNLMSDLAGGREFSSDDESAGDRIGAWGEGLGMFLSHPIFGVGFRNFIENYFITAHNSWVLCFSELGIVGYFFWLAMLVITFKSLNQTLLVSTRGGDQAKWAAILRTSLLGFLTCAFFLSRTYIPNLYLLLALCICTSQFVNTKDEILKAPPPAEIEWAKTTAFLAVTSIAGIYLIVRLKNMGAI